MDRLKELVHEAHRRSLWQVVGVYLAGSWVAFEVVSTLTTSLELPSWVPGLALVLLVVGLPIVIATAFVQEGPPSGEAGAREAPSPPEGEGAEPGRPPGDGAALAAQDLPRALFTWRNAVLGGIMAFCVLFGVAGLVVLFQEDGGSLAPMEARADEAAPAIAVLPFSVRGEGLEMLREGMVDVLSHALDGAAGFRSISNRTILARWRETVPGDDAEADLETHLRVARSAGARYAVVGSAVGLGDRVRLVGDVYEVRSGQAVGSPSVEGEATDLGGLADRLAVSVLTSLAAGGDSFPGVDVDRVVTGSPEALRAFLDGERYLRLRQLERAAAAYRRALAADSAFALAHWRLVEVHEWGETLSFSLQEEHLEAAHRHRDRLTERDALLVEALRSPPRREARLLASAVTRYPDEAGAWYWLGEALVHSPQLMPTAERIERAFDRAIELDPRRPSFYPHAIDLAISLRADSAKAARLAERYAEISRPEGPFQVDLDPRVAPLGVRLAFGGWEGEEALPSAVDTLGPDAAVAAASYLRSPRYWPVASRLLRRYVDREAPSRLQSIRQTLANGLLLNEGRVAEALSLMRDAPRGGAGDQLLEGFTWPAIFHRARVAGLPVPDSVLDRLLSPGLEDPEASTRAVVRAGAWAHGSGRGRDVSRARSILSERAARLERDGRADDARRVRRQRRLLDGRVALAEGRTEEALSLLEAAADGTWAAQWWLGEAYLAAGRYEEAARALGTYAYSDTYTPFGHDPPVRARYARALEGLGRDREAARAYADFAGSWSDAAPAVAGRVEEARRRARALGGPAAAGKEDGRADG